MQSTDIMDDLHNAVDNSEQDSIITLEDVFEVSRKLKAEFADGVNETGKQTRLEELQRELGASFERIVKQVYDKKFEGINNNTGYCYVIYNQINPKL